MRATRRRPASTPSAYSILRAIRRPEEVPPAEDVDESRASGKRRQWEPEGKSPSGDASPEDHCGKPKVQEENKKPRGEKAHYRPKGFGGHGN